MHANTVAVDVTKFVFQIAVADQHWCTVETQRLPRTQFERWFVNRSVDLVVIDLRLGPSWLGSLGIAVRLQPAQYARA